MNNDMESQRKKETASFLEMLSRELVLIKARRERLPRSHSDDPPPKRPAAPPPVQLEIKDAQETSTFGLAFSGGGIRSATFNLGVLQGLAEKGLLTSVDYLSTVSGGGYIGSWLHGIIHRTAGAKPTAAEQMGELHRLLRRGTRDEPGPAHADPITFLRQYSNYLAPRPGLFSADTWTIGFIWLRNVLLNQLILAPAVAAAVAATLFFLLVYQVQFGTYIESAGLDIVATIVTLVCLSAAAVSITRNLRPIARQSVQPTRDESKPVEKRAASSIVTVPLAFTAMVALGTAHFDADAMRWPLVIALVVTMAFIQSAGGFIECYVGRRGGLPLHLISVNALPALWNVAWMSTVAGSVAALLISVAWGAVLGRDPWVHLALGPPLIGLAFIASVMLLVGLMGVDYPDAAREWTAKIGSILGIVTVAWLAWFALAVFGPWAVSWTIGHYHKSGLAAVLAWVLTIAGGVLAGRSPQTKNGAESGKGSPMLEKLVALAPTLFLVGYIVLIATGVHAAMPYVLRPLDTRPPAPSTATVSVNAPADTAIELTMTPGSTRAEPSKLEAVRTFERRYPDGIFELREGNAAITLPSLEPREWTQLAWALVLLAGAFVIALVGSRRININEFSLHHFYKNRLVRCYLGASHAHNRRPHPLTGFDPLDDLPLADLHPEAVPPYLGPYPLINTALNLNAGSELATQERKAASFVFTPAYCGFDPPKTPAAQPAGTPADAKGLDPNGYRTTKGYAYPGGPDIGTAVAISGAAANPNWGYHTSGPMAFLLTVFNARLGWWLGNPRSAQASRRSGPKFALRYLFSELLGQTTGASQFVNLSDGGHFDNLGLYELVRRRARFIIVCDAEEDHALTFGSLGAAIRKCRADFGVEIDINPDPIRIKADGFSTAHCVVGTILYPEPETAINPGLTSDYHNVEPSTRSRGWLLYLKSSLTGDEPADVAEYREQHREFPHQSTADQFFSESQFESYRRLGYHVLRSAFDGVDTGATGDGAVKSRHDLVVLFQGLTRKWYAPIPVTAEAASRLALAYVTLMNRLATTRGLEKLYQELVSGTPASSFWSTRAPTRLEVGAGMELMQLVQNVYTEFGFENAYNRANPRNAGWTSVFRKWRQSPILYQRIWPKIRNDYHPLFQRFVDDLDKTIDVPERP